MKCELFFPTHLFKLFIEFGLFIELNYLLNLRLVCMYVCTTIVYVSWSYALQLSIYVCIISPTHLCRCSSYNALQFCYWIELLKLGLLHIFYILVGTAIVSGKPYNCAYQYI